MWGDFLTLTHKANLEKIDDLSFQIRPPKSRTHHTCAAFQRRQRCVYHMGSARSSRRVQFAWTYEQAAATTLILFQGFLPIVWERTFLLPLGTILIKSPEDKSGPFPGISKCGHTVPTLTGDFPVASFDSSLVTPAVGSLAEYEPWWSCKVAFSGLCHPQK